MSQVTDPVLLDSTGQDIVTGISAVVSAIENRGMPSPSASNPQPIGTASPGTSNDYARGDHVHPENPANVKATQLAYVETGATASQNYTAGQYISWNGILYTANQAISSGTTLNAGTGGNLTECVGGGFNNQLKVKEFTFTTSTLGTSFSQTSRSIDTTQNLFGIDATHICSMQMRDNTLAPASCIILGLWDGRLWVAATQSCTLSDTKPVKIIVTYY